MSAKRPRLSTQETRKIRKILNEEVRLGLNTNSDSETEEVDLKKEMHPLGYYINDREEMIEQMFSLIKGPKLDRMLPPILKDMPLDELKADCLIHLLGMSKKRILSVLDGKEINSSSDSEIEPENSPSPRKKKKSKFIPMIIKQEGCSDISDNSEEVVLVDPDIEEESTSKRKSKKNLKNEESKNSKKSKKKKIEAEKSKKSKITKAPPVKPEKDIVSSPAQEISSDGEAQANPENPKGGKTLLEILELEMRARAIRALLGKGDSTVSEEGTSKVQSTAVVNEEEEEKERESQEEGEIDSNKVTPTRNFRKQNKDKSDDIILVSPKVVTIDLTEENEASSSKKVIDAEHQIEELDNLLSSVANEQAEVRPAVSNDQIEVRPAVSNDQTELPVAVVAEQENEVQLVVADQETDVPKSVGGEQTEVQPAVPTVQEEARLEKAKDQSQSENTENVCRKEEEESNKKSEPGDKSPVIIDEIILTGDNTTESEGSDEDEVISITDSPKRDQTEDTTEIPPETEEHKSSWARRWLDSDKVKEVVKTSKICGKIRKRIKSAKMTKKNEPPIEEKLETPNPPVQEIEGRVDEYLLLTKSQAGLAGGHSKPSENEDKSPAPTENSGDNVPVDHQETSIEQVQDVSSTKVDTVIEKSLNVSDNVGQNETNDSAIGTSVNSSSQDISGDVGESEYSNNDVTVDSTLATQSNEELGENENLEQSQTVDERIDSASEFLNSGNVSEVPDATLEQKEHLTVSEGPDNSRTQHSVEETAFIAENVASSSQSSFQNVPVVCDSNGSIREKDCKALALSNSESSAVSQDLKKSSVLRDGVESNEPETLEISIDDDDTDFE